MMTKSVSTHCKYFPQDLHLAHLQISPITPSCLSRLSSQASPYGFKQLYCISDEPLQCHSVVRKKDSLATTTSMVSVSTRLGSCEQLHMYAWWGGTPVRNAETSPRCPCILFVALTAHCLMFMSIFLGLIYSVNKVSYGHDQWHIAGLPHTFAHNCEPNLHSA